MNLASFRYHQIKVKYGIKFSHTYSIIVPNLENPDWFKNIRELNFM